MRVLIEAGDFCCLPHFSLRRKKPRAVKERARERPLQIRNETVLCRRGRSELPDAE